MRPSFHPRLVNGPFEDPGLFVPLNFRKQAMLFDLGQLGSLSASDILKISHIFVTHTHMDHFAGFDQVLRLSLGRPKTLHLYGPNKFLSNVAAKLGAYTWNLVHNYKDALDLKVTEMEATQATTQIFDCRSGFRPSPAHIQSLPAANLQCLYEEPSLKVSAAILDHQIPCLGFCVKERFHVNILKPQLKALGLTVGPWISELKTLLFQGSDPGTEIKVPVSASFSEQQNFKIGPLAEKITRITPGQKVAYVADVIYSPANEASIVELAHKADHLFIEAAFLEEDRHIAQEKYHLTARQAGLLARKAQVTQMTIFHHSPRYTDHAHLLEQEAREAFEGGK